MIPALALATALFAPAADASSASARDCAQEAEDEARVCHNGWLNLSGCFAQLNLAYYTGTPPAQDDPDDWGYSCNERARYLVEAHEDYRNAEIQAIEVDYAEQALDGTLEHCVDEGAWTCAQLARVSAATEDFLDDIDYCDADAEPVFEDFIAALNAAYLEQCIRGASRFESGDRITAQ